ncbi:MAG: FAD:protein FMN transferase [Gemmataceae bacterium]|nr:FAD:protein FMN transferase [Gemmataceae bacterium]MDW8266490.1 FAD:protein FMN transferase [Gemmataceae bacterium]
MHRRRWLSLEQMVETAGQLAAAVDPAPVSPETLPPREVALHRFGRRAMATWFEVFLPFGWPGALSLAEKAFGELERLEDQLTVYHEASEISRINRLAASRPVVVEERLFGLLERCAALTRATAGAFDITAHALVVAWGFHRRQGRVPTDAERREALARVGMGHVVLEPERRTIAIRRPGVAINLGSIGKGYALDRMAEVLRREGNLSLALLHGGQSSVYAMGSSPASSRGWAVGVQHPWEAGRRLAVVWLRDQGLGTSAATFQHLEHQGMKLGHVLDPRTGWPAGGLASASVVAPTAAEADALATAFFILGVEGARAYCAEHPGIGAILLPEGEGARPVAVGLRPDQYDWCP